MLATGSKTAPHQCKSSYTQELEKQQKEKAAQEDQMAT